MKKKKVAITFPSVPFRSGGAELHVEVLKDKLKHRGYETEIVSVPFKWYPVEHFWEQMLLWRMLDLKETDGDEIDFMIGTKFPSYFAKHDKKIMWLIHQERTAYDGIGFEHSLFRPELMSNEDLMRFRNADSEALKESKKIFTISKNVTNRLEKFNGIQSEPLYHPPKFAGLYESSDYGDYILSIGRLDNMKRIDLLVESMRYTDKNVKCLIGGTGNAKSLLEEKIEKYNLQDKVILLGFVSDEELLKLYSNAFAVYFAPKDEDYGYITLEALLSKRPIVTSVDSGGVLEFVEDGKSGIVTDPTAEEFAKAINQLYHNKSLCKEMGNYGFNSVKDISWDYALERIIGEFNKL